MFKTNSIAATAKLIGNAVPCEYARRLGETIKKHWKTMAQFKTLGQKALDLLGRQQIAGIPTAINELIKNAHDAYADKFDIDFLRCNNLLVLRDDRLGMTKEFETRWLTLGTK